MSYESYSARGRIAQLARGIAATIAVVALVVGIPYLLCRFVGWPLPRHVPTWHAITSALGQRDISDTTVVDVLATALWICWAVLVLAFVVETIAPRTLAHCWSHADRRSAPTARGERCSGRLCSPSRRSWRARAEAGQDCHARPSRRRFAHRPPSAARSPSS
jgi:hypothetical protein